ncbi:MAG: hypothetical protein KVP17_004742 [Porospora cf. gigantea B]|uniref:uncharacterized protein n=1 Tax=Porospora cf. gigantea B TaxID=2853592 RepID=UPI003571FA9D|nr:MAG: hypothetical protein KVP17_004742 [Porospora cf. gigantea B]
MVFDDAPVVVVQPQYRKDDLKNGAFVEPLYDIVVFDVTRATVEVGIFASNAPQRSSVVVGLMAFVAGVNDLSPYLQSAASLGRPDSDQPLTLSLPYMSLAGNCAVPFIFANHVESADTPGASFRAPPSTTTTTTTTTTTPQTTVTDYVHDACLLTNIDFPGSASWYGVVADMDACVNSCLRTDGCHFVTYTNRSCWHKYTDTGYTSYSGLTSARMSCVLANRRLQSWVLNNDCVENHIAFVGNDIRYVTTPSVSTCAQMCSLAVREGCSLCTWTDWTQECYLKTAGATSEIVPDNYSVRMSCQLNWTTTTTTLPTTTSTTTATTTPRKPVSLTWCSELELFQSSCLTPTSSLHRKFANVIAFQSSVCQSKSQAGLFSEDFPVNADELGSDSPLLFVWLVTVCICSGVFSLACAAILFNMRRTRGYRLLGLQVEHQGRLWRRWSQEKEDHEAQEAAAEARLEAEERAVEEENSRRLAAKEEARRVAEEEEREAEARQLVREAEEKAELQKLEAAELEAAQYPTLVTVSAPPLRRPPPRRHPHKRDKDADRILNADDYPDFG